MTGSLAYRKNEPAILRGVVPEKYQRLLPYISGDYVLEIGSAEGVLALLLARQGKCVTALERSAERHEIALKLRDEWIKRSFFQKACEITHIQGDITDRLDLLSNIDTLVAVRMIYYLRDQLDEVFCEVAAQVPTVVLCGNRNRAKWWHDGVPDKKGGPINYYASRDGMVDLLKRHGYDQITYDLTFGDPIVVGQRALG